MMRFFKWLFSRRKFYPFKVEKDLNKIYNINEKR